MARTTREDIQGWLNEAQRKGATHMVVACDTFSYEDYPIYVLPNQDVHRVVADHSGQNMQTVMEVYCMHLPLDQQLAEHRAYHLDAPPPGMQALQEARQANRRKMDDLVEKLTKLGQPKKKAAPKAPKTPKKKRTRKTVWSRLRKPEI